MRGALRETSIVGAIEGDGPIIGQRTESPRIGDSIGCGPSMALALTLFGSVDSLHSCVQIGCPADLSAPGHQFIPTKGFERPFKIRPAAISCMRTSMEALKALRGGQMEFAAATLELLD